MDQLKLRNLLEDLRQGECTVDQVIDQLKILPYEVLDGFANLDHHRLLRTGFPEVIFAQGKTPEQVVEIFLHLEGQCQQVLATRVNSEMYSKVQDSAARCNISSLCPCVISRPRFEKSETTRYPRSYSRNIRYTSRRRGSYHG